MGALHCKPTAVDAGEQQQDLGERRGGEDTTPAVSDAPSPVAVQPAIQEETHHSDSEQIVEGEIEVAPEAHVVDTATTPEEAAKTPEVVGKIVEETAKIPEEKKPAEEAQAAEIPMKETESKDVKKWWMISLGFPKKDHSKPAKHEASKMVDVPKEIEPKPESHEEKPEATVVPAEIVEEKPAIEAPEITEPEKKEPAPAAVEEESKPEEAVSPVKVEETAPKAEDEVIEEQSAGTETTTPAVVPHPTAIEDLPPLPKTPPPVETATSTPSIVVEEPSAPPASEVSPQDQ